ncbi:MAG: molybdopterin cofactor-binding domain-containing protein [Sphingomonadaceae bacterium]|nr:molybdopterin cofactor-binding domain-containing protein [Sphingomonadaceae bacterium]
MHAPLTPRPEPQRRSRWRAARRTVLIGGGAGLGLAVGWAVWPRSYPVNLAPRRGTHVVSAWLRIGEDGRIVVICPQAEMGQGTQSGLAQLLADELGADWRTVEVEPAPLSGTYANVAAFADAAAGKAGIFAGLARYAVTEAVQRFDLQLTGGSTSIRSFHQTMREAGAAARAVLCKAAAERWGMDWRRCDTRDGFVIGGANRIRFAELAADAAKQTPPRRLELRPVRPEGVVRPRLDVPAKVDGSAVFGIDVRRPGMVYAAVRHGPAGDRGKPQLPASAPPGAIAMTGGPGWVAVVADRWWAAKQAADALAPKWAASAGLADQAQIDAALARAAAGGGELPGQGRLITAGFSVPYVAHASLEPMNATAHVHDRRVEVWAPTQSTSLVTAAVARALDVAERDVTVYPTLIGGGFGRKAEVDAAVQAALIARDVRRPVQLIWSREEEFRAAPMRPAAHARYQARLRPDGGIEAWHARIASQSVGQQFAKRNMPSLAFGEGKPDSSAIEGADALPYAVGTLTAEHVNVLAAVPVGYWRSVGHSYTAFMNERFVDRLAAEAKQDPMLYRLRLLANRPRHKALLTAVGERAGYAQGMGVAIHESFGSIAAVVADCALEPAPRVKRVTIGIDCGQVVNPDLVRQQMEGAVVWALSAALKSRVTWRGGYPEQENFDRFTLLPLAETPRIDVLIATNPAYPLGGVGEAGVPPVAPAVANAFAVLTGRAFDTLPLVFA